MSQEKRTPKPNEIWRTKSGRFVLVVEHQMTEVEGKLGFIWFDEVDKNLNFSPLLDQLDEFYNLTTAEWGMMMGELVKCG